MRSRRAKLCCANALIVSPQSRYGTRRDASIRLPPTKAIPDGLLRSFVRRPRCSFAGGRRSSRLPANTRRERFSSCRSLDVTEDTASLCKASRLRGSTFHGTEPPPTQCRRLAAAVNDDAAIAALLAMAEEFEALAAAHAPRKDSEKTD